MVQKNKQFEKVIASSPHPDIFIRYEGVIEISNDPPLLDSQKFVLMVDSTSEDVLIYRTSDNHEIRLFRKMREKFKDSNTIFVQYG